MFEDIIVTPRLILRHFRVEDATYLHQIFADPEAMRYWSTPPHQTAEQTMQYVLKTIAATEEGSGDDFVIVRDGKVIGKAGLWNNKEVGFVVAKDLWRQGFGTEALYAVIHRAKKKMVRKITADVDPRNESSIALLKFCGFVETGRRCHTIKVGENWVDSIFFERHL